MKSLFEQLKNNKTIPMHMPGHKRNTALAPYLKCLGADLDITEIGGFDNLHNATGILKESMQKAADLRKADCAFYLVNGSTGGILAAVCSLLLPGEKVIVARNCHKSVYNAIELSGAVPVFVLPEAHKESGILAGIGADEIEVKIKENPDARLVVITSPTYEGVVSDIKKISKICKKSGVILLVDGAHGAHFGFCEGFPEDAMSQGADIVVESLHKTLPSLTQTAICYAKKDFAEELQEKLAVFQTSSPSYLLMASIDECINLIKEKGDEIFTEWQENLKNFYKKCEELRNIRVLRNSGGFVDRDMGKIVILCENGKWLFEELQKKGIECEMAACSYVLAMTGPGDTQEMLSYFAASLLEIDKLAAPCKNAMPYMKSLPKREMGVKEAQKHEKMIVNISDAVGKTAAEYVWAYPPGIPLIVPGEVIGKAEIEIFEKYMATGIELFGSGKTDSGKILVIK